MVHRSMLSMIRVTECNWTTKRHGLASVKQVTWKTKLMSRLKQDFVVKRCDFREFTESNITTYESGFSDLIAVTLCYVCSFTNTNILLQLLNSAYSPNEKRRCALQSALTMSGRGHI